METRDDVVVRFRPRPNLDVNRHFMCDYGRMNYRWLNRGDRIEAPLAADGGRHAAVDWDTALDRLGALVRGAASIALLASGRASTESLGLRDPGPLRGHVVDFLQLYAFPAIFNVADVAITSAMVLFILLTVRGVNFDGTRTKRTPKSVKTEAPGDAA